MLSFLPPEITAAGATILPRRFKLYHYLSLPGGTEILRWETLAAPRSPLPQDDKTLRRARWENALMRFRDKDVVGILRLRS